MSNEEKIVLLELVKSLNMGNSGYQSDRVEMAKNQLRELRRVGYFDKPSGGEL